MERHLKKIIALALLLPIPAFAQTPPKPVITSACVPNEVLDDVASFFQLLGTDRERKLIFERFNNAVRADLQRQMAAQKATEAPDPKPLPPEIPPPKP